MSKITILLNIIDLVNAPVLLNLFSVFSFIFLIGLIGIVSNSNNFLLTLLFIELMYLGIISSLILVSVITCDPTMQVYALLTLILAACESAIGLGILIVLYRHGRTLKFGAYEALHG